MWQISYPTMNGARQGNYFQAKMFQKQAKWGLTPYTNVCGFFLQVKFATSLLASPCRGIIARAVWHIDRINTLIKARTAKTRLVDASSKKIISFNKSKTSLKIEIFSWNVTCTAWHREAIHFPPPPTVVILTKKSETKEIKQVFIVKILNLYIILSCISLPVMHSLLVTLYVTEYSVINYLPRCSYHSLYINYLPRCTYHLL